MTDRRTARALQHLGLLGGGTSRLARPPTVLEEPDIRPRPVPAATVVGTFYMDADATNTYLDTIDTGNPQGVIWDETTQTGTLTAVAYDDAVSLTFIQVLQAITVQPDGGAFFGYADVSFSPTATLGTVSLDLIFYDDTATEIDRFTGTNSGSTSTVGLLIDTAVSVPAGGSIRLEVTFTTAGTFTYGGDIELGFTIP